MARSPGGKSAGRVTIRVLPDTSDFRRDLIDKLKVIQQRTKMTITVDKVKLDQAAVKASLQRQFDRMSKQTVEVKALVREVTVRKVEVRKSLQKQFDDLGLVVKVGVDLTRAKQEVKRFVHDVNGKDVSLNVNADTFAASRRMAFVARTRVVTLLPQVSKAAAAKAAASIAAISGGRVAFNWVKDLGEWIADLDKNLPALATIVTSILTLSSLILGSIQSLVGLGAGLSAIIPTFLVIPGLLLGTAVAITAFAVAMADAKQQLGSLSDEMTAIKNVIQTDFWAAARQPILDLVNNTFPQLLEAFSLVSSALGRFTGGLATSFEKALSGGKLTALFKGIADSFDILTTGTDAFAGALVSLSAIAAKYAPRLAQWFVDIANQFDDWLIAVANDGRLDDFMETGIQAIKDLGNTVRGLARIFDALWTAAENAGTLGLGGWATTLNNIADVMNQPKFQTALTSIFEGANLALDHLTVGLKDFGNALAFLAPALTFVLETSGAIFGEFLTAFSGALSNPAVLNNLVTAFAGLRQGFAGFDKFLPQIVEGFSSIARFAGVLATAFGPVLGQALAAFVPIITALMSVLTPFVKLLSGQLQSALATFSDSFSAVSGTGASLTTFITGFVDSAATALEQLVPVLLAAAVQLFTSIADALPVAIPRIVRLIGTLGPQIFAALVTMIGALADQLPVIIKGLLDAIVALAPSLVTSIIVVLQQLSVAILKSLPLIITAIFQLLEGIGKGFTDSWPILLDTAKKLWPELIQGLVKQIPIMLTAASDFFDSVNVALVQTLPQLLAGWSEVLPIIIQALVDAIPALVEAGVQFFTSIIESNTQAIPLIVEAWDQLFPQILDGLSLAIPALIQGGITFFVAMVNALTQALPVIVGAIVSIMPQIINAFVAALPQMISASVTLFLAVVQGLSKAMPQIIAALIVAMPQLMRAIISCIPLFVSAGVQIVQGLIQGFGNMLGALQNAAVRLATAAITAIKNALGIKSPSRVFRFEVGAMIPAGIMAGLEDGKAQLNAALTHLVTVPDMPTMPTLSPDVLGGDGGIANTFNANFSLMPQPGIPLADQVFQAAQRLKARSS